MSTSFTYETTASAGSAEAIVRLISPSELKDQAAQWVQPQIDNALRAAQTKGLFRGELEQAETFATLGLHSANHIVFVGIGEEAGLDELRLAGAVAAKAIMKLKAQSVQLLLPQSILAGKLSPGAAAQALTEGLRLAVHDRLPELRNEKQRYSLAKLTFAPAAELADPESFARQWANGIALGHTVADGVIAARDLTNMAGNRLLPEGLATYAEDLAREYDLDIEIIDEWTALEQGMGGLLAVGQGSVHPPRMIVLHYKGAPDDAETWGLIGKGITFDTGGISLKKAAGMEEMISDMGGAAAVLGAMRVIGELKPSVNIIAVVPTAENMPSDRAFKPGDIIKMMNGLTVEVVNTDAEGRLVLGDGLTTAIRRGATKLVDIATLTGAVLAALGIEATGAITNNEALMEQVKRASERSGERVWQLPAYPEYKKQLNSDAADLKNSGGRYAGTITGGLFVGAFAEDLPWVHLDIAGTAFLDRSRGWEPKGATGVMVRTLVELVTEN
ncbi:leucyl aminopeptidase [Paenibacillus radicis (ex Gao et al. 2016)]|uniref:Probable cytosol aminopeptidase n=1 Tax=Paenibacillus radicis (ex Gao et al. 2016) TaxID=1737354 RepID=A0A917HFN3_9BACL|nr:leucyl aminopeptidase [Paenibacillus radicis (ex Gao et al. 2016)]GGG77158.1 putative cytosol aminopeptidase [Paenibacillus radicis (ex Gao et al. 2016)]